MVVVLQYNEKDEEKVEKLLKSITGSISTKYGEIRLVYQGSEERVVSALEKILKLTE